MQVAAFGIDKRPLLLMMTLPKLVVATVLLKVKALPVRLIPRAFDVAMAPLNVVVLVPALCARMPAVMAFAVTLFTEEKVRVSKAAVLPTAPVSMILPLPAAKVRLRVKAASPSIVFEKVMSPPLVETVAVIIVSRTTATGNVTALFTVVIFPPRKI